MDENNKNEQKNLGSEADAQPELTNKAAEEAAEKPADKTEETASVKGDEKADGHIASGGGIVGAPEQPGKKNRIVVLIIAAVVIIIAVCVAVFLGGKFASPDIEPTSEESSEDSPIYGDIEWILANEDSSEGFTDKNGAYISREEYIEQINGIVAAATTSLNPDVGTTSPLTIVENTAAPITQGAAAQDSDNADKAYEQIKSFLSRQCYISGALYAGNTGSPMSISFDGDDFDILTNIEDVEVSVMRVDGVLYIKRIATKQYLEMTDAVMSLLGISAEDFAIDFGGISFSDYEESFVGSYDVQINGEAGVCHEFSKPESTLKFYSVNGQLKEIRMLDSSGAIETQISIDKFSQSIPGDQLSLKGYTRSSVTAIFADMM